MKRLTEKDNAFINEVLQRAYDIAEDNNNGDFAIAISKQDIRDNTGRTIVRDVVLDSYSETFAESYNTTARIVGDRVIVNIPSNNFSPYTLNQLRTESEDIRNPELEEDD